jgi:hypothetical protein
MENLKLLERKVANQGWFGGELQLKITLKNQFEGYYGRASESWETQVEIEIVAPNNQSMTDTQIPNIKVTGNRFQTIEDVAAIVLRQWNQMKQNEKI